MRIRRLATALALATLAVAPASVGAQEEGRPGLEGSCFEPAARAAGESAEEVAASRFLPDGDLFRPVLADMKEPRFYGGIRSVDFEGPALPGGGRESITAGVTAFGETFGIWRTREAGSCDGVQIGVFTGVFSQFDLDAPSSDLINTDFTVGPRITARRGRWSARLRAFHQSSHLGDEFLIRNPDLERRNLSFEAVDALVSVTGRLGWLRGRFYGGGGYVVSSSTGLDPGLFQWGLELRGPRGEGGEGSFLRPVAGADFRSFDEHDWETTASLKGGVEWSSAPGARTLRLLVVYLNGFMPFGQFFSNTQLSNVGAELQFSF